MGDVFGVALELVQVGVVGHGVEDDGAYGDAEGPKEGGGQAGDADRNKGDEAEDCLLVEGGEHPSGDGDCSESESKDSKTYK